MKILLSLALAISMTMSLSASVFSVETPPVDPPEVTDAQDDIMPLVSLFEDSIYSTNGTWTSPEFAAAPSNGNYIRYWFQNNTNEDVKVYLYRTDKSTSEYALMMIVGANDQNYTIYHNSTAGSGTYKIVVEAYTSGSIISGNVAAAQYIRPDL